MSKKRNKMLKRKTSNTTNKRRSIALRLGPNLRAIAPLETQNWIKSCLSLLNNHESNDMPKLAYKEQKPSCSSCLEIATVVQKFKKLLSKATALIFIHDEDQAGFLN